MASVERFNKHAAKLINLQPVHRGLSADMHGATARGTDCEMRGDQIETLIAISGDGVWKQCDSHVAIYVTMMSLGTNYRCRY